MPEPTSEQGAARFRADLASYLNSLFLHELGDLLGELPEPTRVALMHELSERGPARRIEVFSGAGISTESGIPDFRSPGGLWTR